MEDAEKLHQEVIIHLNQVRHDPATVLLDEELLRRAERNTDRRTPREILWRLLSTGEDLLAVLQQDPRPLTKLLEQVVVSIPFDELKKHISAEKLEQGLLSPSAPIQLLVLAYLQKAADLPSGAAFVACSPTLTKVLTETWLSTTNTEVADKALDVLTALLTVDSPSTTTFVVAHEGSGEALGQGLLWRRLFEDSDIYILLYAWTSLTQSKHDISTKQGRQQVTISQGRMFDFLARIASVDWARITTSSILNVEKKYIKTSANEEPYGGLLRYAATDMIDLNDILMQVLRQDFFMRLLGVVEENGRRGVSTQEFLAIQQAAGTTDSINTEDGLHL